MPEATVRVVSSEGDGFRRVVTFEPVYVPDQDEDDKSQSASGRLTLIIKAPSEDEEAGDEYKVGAEYSINLSEVRGQAESPYAESYRLAEAAKAIPNSTNTRGYKTPPELKVPPIPVPDGVVTEPRPSVVLPPVTDTPPTAGVAVEAPVLAPASAQGRPAVQNQTINSSERR